MAVKNILIWMFLPTLFLASLSQADIPLETSPTWQWDESIGERAVGALAWGDVDGDGDDYHRHKRLQKHSTVSQRTTGGLVRELF